MKTSKLLRMISVLLSVMILSSVLTVFPVFAAVSGETGSCTWSFDESTGIIRISAKNGGLMPDYEHYNTKRWTDENGVKHDSDLPWYSYKSKIKSVILGYGVKYIGKGAFNGLKNSGTGIEVYLCSGVSLGELSFGNSVITSIDFGNIGNIGEKAFYGTQLPNELYINAEYIGKNAFESTKITKLTFGSKLTKIDDYAFSGCSKLRTVSFNSNLRTIGAYAFAGFTSPYDKTGLYVPSTVVTIGERAFGFSTGGSKSYKFIMFTEKNSAADKYAQENELPVEYGKQFFTNYYNADWTLDKTNGILCLNCETTQQYDEQGWNSKMITPDASDEYWSNFADQYGSYVRTVQIGTRNDYTNVINEISTGFSLFKNLNTVEIFDKSVTVIQDKAFKGAKNLKSVTLSENMETIGEEAFADCSSLQTVNFNNSIKEIKDGAFSGCGLLSLKIGDKIENKEENEELKIGKNAYKYCTSLASVYLGERVSAIPDSCFEGCIKLNNVEYSNKLSSIGDSAFKNCRTLKTIMIGKELSSIGSEAFLNTEVSGLFIPAEITDIGSQALCYYNDGSSSFVNSDAVLYVSEDSAALNYAKSNGIKYEINAGGSLGNTSWRYNPTTFELIISGKGEMEEFSVSNTAPWMEYAYKIKSVKIGDGITTISRKAFADDFLNMESVTIGDSVHSIGMQAFYNCPLKTVTIPESVTEIRKQAFGYLENAYGDVSKNTDLVMRIKKGSAAETYAVDNGLNYEFTVTGGDTGECTWLCDPNTSSLTISGNGKMGSYEKSFDTPWCSFSDEIKYIYIENGVTNVGKKAFMSISNLEKVFLPETILEIEEGAFANDEKLKDIYIPSKCETIADRSLGFSYLYPDVDDITGILDHDFLIMSLDPSSEAINYARSRFNMKYDYVREGKVGNCIWQYNYADTLTVTGKGSLECESFPWDEYRNEIAKLVVDYGIITVPDNAFAHCPNLKTVQIYDTVTSIGKGVFEGDTALESFYIPSYVTEVEERVFKDCTALDCTYIMHNNIKKIGNSAFENCTSMSYYTLPEFVEEIGDRAFANTGTSYVTFPDSLRSVGEYAYFNTAIKDVDIPETVEKIGDYAFGFKGTEEEIQPAADFKITALRDSAGHKYAEKYGIAWINTVDGDIGDVHWEFDTETSVLTVSGTGDIPDKSNSYWVRHKGNIKEIVIQDGITGIGASNFSGLTKSFAKPVKVKIPYSVEYIGISAFADTAMESISIPAKVKKIDISAFSDTGLQNIKINAGVQEIADYAFVNTCETSIEIPDSVTKLGEYSIGYDNWYGGLTSFEIRAYDEYVVIGSKGSEAERYVNDNEGLLFKEYIPETEPTEPTETEPTATEPIVTDPTVTEPTATEPTATEPTVTEPTATEPTVTEPTVTVPTVTEPTATEPTVPIATEPVIAEKTDITGWQVKGIKNKTYTGRKLTQKITVTDGSKTATVKISYKNNVNAGKATLTVTGTGDYTGTIVKTFKIAKATQKMKVKTSVKSVKYSAVKKKAQTVKKAISVTKSYGKLTYSKVSKGSSKYLTISKSGVITVKKKTKRGTYKISVKVTAKGNNNYKSATKTLTVTIKIK